MGKIRNAVKFKGTWRNYQARVLKQSDKYLSDGKIHIVAAPGSGKTTLGIELIGKTDSPCLILAPSITIREQWLERIREGFGVPEEMLSGDIKNAAEITAITYQALHSCIKRMKSAEEDECGKKEEKDYRDFDFYKTIQDNGIKTLCLDEAHHLRSEWQKALEEVVQKLDGCTIISLTATPPYDSTPLQWKRYTDLCGPIDEEITVPELVKEGSLCAHQDYVYFSFPVDSEKERFNKFKNESKNVSEELLSDPELRKTIGTHICLKDPDKCTAAFIQNPEYFKALTAYFNDNGILYNHKLLRDISDETDLSGMNLHFLEIILQGLLYDDKESYECPDEYRKHLESVLKVHGLIHNGTVELEKNSEINKMLTTSIGKLESIKKIAASEFLNMREDLRMLILTDYIRKEFLSAVGNSEKEITEMGVVTIFEAVRRLCEENNSLSDAELRPAALSGSVVIIPEAALSSLSEMAEKNGQKVNSHKCGETPYFQVTLSGSGPTATVYLTELLAKGEIRILVGTKSLLGEGWDSPCINSLILASFVGSYMLSNQMRGRAIRAMKGNPEKASNIWHLICMEPAVTEEEAVDESDDFSTLKRRFKGFLGVNYDRDIIENGMDRLTFITPPYSENKIEDINMQMLEKAGDRKGLFMKWQKVLNGADQMELADEAGTEANKLISKSLLNKAVTDRNIKNAAAAGTVGLTVFMFAGGHIVLGAAALGASVWTAVKAVKSIKNAKKFTDKCLFMKSLGNGILNALIKSGHLTNGSELRTEAEIDENSGMCYVYLTGGTEREKGIFADVCAEFFADIGNQRYIMSVSEKNNMDIRYYCVPELFSGKKEDARLFSSLMEPWIGKSELIYTRAENGKKAHLNAKLKSLSSSSKRETQRVKRLKAIN